MTSAIIVAAGSSRRMGFNKLLAPLAGEPVLRRTLGAFQACDAIDEIIVVTSDALRPDIEAWRTSGLGKVTQIISGGAERHLSVHAGLQALNPACQIVAVHDGARPLISVAQITRCIEAARTQAAVACARPMTETLKRCDSTGRIIDSIDRANAWIMETPQVFQLALLVRAYDAVLRDGLLVTDEVSAVQHLGESVFVVENFELNPKITFPADILLAQRFVD
ncbi:MAG: 2-C-methyl-D-erythritol 4-phosphate cytidylyltransferase [Prosthecobacter sp.]|uniref:2-C-methyl-D-erythritol 4-phosphate cytidylyltransferase n=1 Tax=Prosthecobacter sp. TaxID=1965333 RepID=UPI00262340A6|nr:2-C-methyl-D-erythritol 4-phosphate cytidylyltransferase [Prosthecobacter sp.]MCF7789806.1 2-C-methyl-D-erythritol 4-phosphate cytidylyltransferase [Prosthecobacter sp.]